MNNLLGVRDRITKRAATVYKTIKQLDEELAKCKKIAGREVMNPVDDISMGNRVRRVCSERGWYTTEREKLYNQIFDLDRLIYSSEAVKDAQQTASALEAAQKELNRMRNKLPREMMGLVNSNNEILESLLGRGHNVLDDDMGGVASDEAASSNFQP